MPFARLTIADPSLPSAVRQDLVTGVVDLLDRLLDKEAADAVCHVNLVPAESWYVAGRHPEGATGAHLEVSITAGTNTEEQKAAFLDQAYRLLGDRLGRLPEAVYVALYELDGRAYGFNGVSQYARHAVDPQGRD